MVFVWIMVVVWWVIIWRIWLSIAEAFGFCGFAIPFMVCGAISYYLALITYMFWYVALIIALIVGVIWYVIKK